MPVSLDRIESQRYEPLQPNTISTIKTKLKTTNKMVEEALITLHSAKGVTLKQIYNFILTNNHLETLSRIRIALIKKYIISIRESEDILNITGKGFLGRFKLVDKKKFIKKISTNTKEAKENLTAMRKTKKLNTMIKTLNKGDQVISKSKNVQRSTKKRTPSTKQNYPVISRQIRPPLLHNTIVSMFDTPLVPSQVHASTPLITTTFIPQAPEVKKRTNKRQFVGDNSETPRSSGKKRKLLKRPGIV